MNPETSGKALEVQADVVESADIGLNQEVSLGSSAAGRHPLLIFGIASIPRWAWSVLGSLTDAILVCAAWEGVSTDLLILKYFKNFQTTEDSAPLSDRGVGLVEWGWMTLALNSRVCSPDQRSTSVPTPSSGCSCSSSLGFGTITSL